MGKESRDAYLTKLRLTPIDFLPERPYVMECGARAIPRKGTRDFQMLFIPREQELMSYLNLKENETFVDLGANAGAYTLMIARIYKGRGVKVIAVEAHPDNYNALCRNIQINDFTNVRTINKAVSDHSGIISLYERSHDGTRVDSDIYTTIMDDYNIGRVLQLECDSLDNMLADHRIDVMKMDIESAEAIALTAATNTLKKLRRIVVEIHGGNLGVVERILKQHGFDIQITKMGMTYLIGSKKT
jgi:FkbM family methyltransferase